MKLPIYQSAWSTIYNLSRTKLEKVKKTAKEDQSMVHGNTGKRNVDDDKEKGLPGDYFHFAIQARQPFVSFRNTDCEGQHWSLIY